MRFKKIVKMTTCLIFIIFAVAGFETLREEVRDQKLKKKNASLEMDPSEKSLVFSAFCQAEAKNEDVCFFTVKVATYIDHILYRGSKNSLREPAAKFFAKSISVTVLTVSLFSDALHYSMRGLFDTSHRELHFQKAKRCSLGLISFPSGLIYPDLVSQHFATNAPPCQLIQPYRKLYSAKSLQLYPKTYEDVAEIIKEA